MLGVWVVVEVSALGKVLSTVASPGDGHEEYVSRGFLLVVFLVRQVVTCGLFLCRARAMYTEKHQGPSALCFAFNYVVESLFPPSRVVCQSLTRREANQGWRV